MFNDNETTQWKKLIYDYFYIKIEHPLSFSYQIRPNRNALFLSLKQCNAKTMHLPWSECTDCLSANHLNNSSYRCQNNPLNLINEITTLKDNSEIIKIYESPSRLQCPLCHALNHSSPSSNLCQSNINKFPIIPISSSVVTVFNNCVPLITSYDLKSLPKISEDTCSTCQQKGHLRSSSNKCSFNKKNRTINKVINSPLSSKTTKLPTNSTSTCSSCHQPGHLRSNSNLCENNKNNKIKNLHNRNILPSIPEIIPEIITEIITDVEPTVDIISEDIICKSCNQTGHLRSTSLLCWIEKLTIA